MSSTLASAVVGALFGLALAAPPGPMNAIIAEESVLRGFRPGFRAGLGAMSADVLFFLLTVAGVAAVIDRHDGLYDLLFLIGGLLMLAFAVEAFRNARSAAFTHEAVGASAGFRKTFALSLTNPYQIAFWLTVGVGLVRPGSLEPAAHVPGVLAAAFSGVVVETGSPALLVGFFAGIAVWIVCYPATLVAAGRRIDAVAPVVAALSGLVLAGFGALFAWIGLAALL